MTVSINDSQSAVEVRKVLGKWFDHVCKYDLDPLMDLYANDIRSFDAVMVQEIKGKDAYRAHWKQCMEHCRGSGGEMIMERRDEIIEADKGAAFATYLLRCGLRKEDGAEDVGHFRATFCLKRIGNGWFIVHEHHSAPFDPITNTVLMATD